MCVCRKYMKVEKKNEYCVDVDVELESRLNRLRRNEWLVGKNTSNID